ncbi:MAG: hypothetical protein U0105_21935 [Candidatus Obscuribacterales bacterium]
MKHAPQAIITLLTLVSVSLAVPAQAKDNNVTSAAKAVGKGIVWLPKKMMQGVKAVGKGLKKGSSSK